MDRSTHRAVIVHISEDVWAKIIELTPPHFRPEDTIAIAAAAFVDTCSSTLQSDCKRSS